MLIHNYFSASYYSKLIKACRKNYIWKMDELTEDVIDELHLEHFYTEIEIKGIKSSVREYENKHLSVGEKIAVSQSIKPTKEGAGMDHEGIDQIVGQYIKSFDDNSVEISSLDRKGDSSLVDEPQKPQNILELMDLLDNDPNMRSRFVTNIFELHERMESENQLVGYVDNRKCIWGCFVQRPLSMKIETLFEDDSEKKTVEILTEYGITRIADLNEDVLLKTIDYPNSRINIGYNAFSKVIKLLFCSDEEWAEYFKKQDQVIRITERAKQIKEKYGIYHKENGDNVSQRGWSPLANALHMAIRYNDLEAIELLLSEDHFSVDTRDEHQVAAYELAESLGNKKVIELMDQYKIGQSGESVPDDIEENEDNEEKIVEENEDGNGIEGVDETNTNETMRMAMDQVLWFTDPLSKEIEKRKESVVSLQQYIVGLRDEIDFLKKQLQDTAIKMDTQKNHYEQVIEERDRQLEELKQHHSEEIKVWREQKKGWKERLMRTIQDTFSS